MPCTYYLPTYPHTNNSGPAANPGFFSCWTCLPLPALACICIEIDATCGLAPPYPFFTTAVPLDPCDRWIVSGASGGLLVPTPFTPAAQLT